jgi:hypothetical protein
MVLPAASAELCPQCGADVRTCGARCRSCGFWLPSTPAPRTGPPTARPSFAVREGSKNALLGVIFVGGVIVLGLVFLGAIVWSRSGAVDGLAVNAGQPAALLPAHGGAPDRLEPTLLLMEARGLATAWHRDAVLVSISVGPLDARGVAADGAIELAFARPNGARISGGSDTAGTRFTLRSTGGPLTSSEEHAGKGRVAPEPNCLFEDAWAAAQRAGASAESRMRLRYVWSEKHDRPVWEVVNAGGDVQRRIDGITCSILTR